MAEVIMIGSSSGDPSPSRANASLLIKEGGSFYQFDAGEGFSSSIKRLEINHHKIASIFITHMHPDHITGLFLEIQMMFLGARREELFVYVPEEAKEPIEKFIAATYLFDEKIGFDVIVKPIYPDPLFRDDNITVYSRQNSHLDKYRNVIEKGKFPNLMQSYSFIIKTKNRKIIYSGDIGSSDDYADLLGDCDLLVTEGMHLKLEKLFEAAVFHKVKNLILTHLPDVIYNAPEEVFDLAKKYGVRNMYLAEEGFTLKV